jgi:hypothetical protein
MESEEQAEVEVEETLVAKGEDVEQGDGEGGGDDNSESNFEVAENRENAENAEEV